jgi:hypothetical protein
LPEALAGSWNAVTCSFNGKIRKAGGADMPGVADNQPAWNRRHAWAMAWSGGAPARRGKTAGQAALPV